MPSRHPLTEYAERKSANASALNDNNYKTQQRQSSAIELKEKPEHRPQQDQTNNYRASFYSGSWKAPSDKVSTLLAKSKPVEKSTASDSQAESCSIQGCKRRNYRTHYCKQHFIGTVMKAVRRELRNLYRGADRAYGTFDFTGVGYIKEADFIDSFVCRRLPFSKEDIKDFLFQTNAFVGGGQTPAGGMNFDSFKKMFFPHLSQVQDGNLYSGAHEGGLDEEAQRKLKLKNLITNTEHHQEEIQARIRGLERKLKERFSHFDSVRKAFLGLDTDYDGYITVEDILRSFGHDNSREFNFNDLKKLISEKDSSGLGRLGYTDFSKWVGNSIHQSEGFYFRHDSVKNPQYEQWQESPALKNNEMCKEEASRQLINQTLAKTIIEKIKFQWKTIRKAFSDMNKERDGAIEEDELRFYLQHWGLKLTDEQFKYIFNMFDADGDGMINYMDFHNTVGHEIHPGESLYFRQDKPFMMRINKCEHPKCWQTTESVGSNFCELHSKMYIDKGLQYFQRLFRKLGPEQWPKLVKAVRRQAERDEEYQQIFFDKFVKILEDQFSIPVSEHDKDLLKKTFPGRNEGDRVRITISCLYDMNYTNKINKVYRSVNMAEGDLDDVAVDLSGYIGVFHRKEGDPGPKDKHPFTWLELAAIFVKLEQNERNLKLAHIMRSIKQIDQDNNGYVTSTELDDILKLTFVEELKGKNLKPLFQPFESLQNKILIDYKKFRDRLLEHIKYDTSKEKERNSSIEMKRSQIADKLQRLRDSKNGSCNVSSLSKSFQFSTVRESMTKSRVEQASKIEKSPSTLNRQSLDRFVQQCSPPEFSRKLELNNDTNRVSLEERRERLINRLNMCRSTLSKDGSRQQPAIRASFEPTKNNKESLFKGTMEHSQSEKEDFRPYQQQSSKIRTSLELDSLRDSATFFKRNNDQRTLDYSVNEDDSRRRAATAACKVNQSHLPRHLESIKQKLSYDWKGLYRLLSSEDIQCTGIVAQRKFEEALRASGVFVSAEDLNHIFHTFGGAVRGGTERVINYQKLSLGLGLHQRSFNLMSSTHTMINKMKSESRQAALQSISFKRPQQHSINQ